ncbi:unnamed protein product [Rotaria sp. Silwood2]|nr:unnamed protein product [Rotaria sp. Silwood2]CAF2777956.1 unnamed protein product [Rotaria sp. Silwood2]CAF3021693.1 unnamed protein product [Rotaria sp. Silwood2]CAF3177383.1 unnamed protein product [Rotaria sp. Silwood2]CAF4043479.1 unnamed protein product [Rotaria sp. Silwood2]
MQPAATKEERRHDSHPQNCKNKQVGIVFAQSNDNNNSSQIPILFIIESDIDSLSLATPFADIHHRSQFDDEEEVLFMIGAIFHIVAVQVDDNIDDLWTIKLVLCNERSNELFEVLEELRQKLLPEKTNCMSVGDILMEMELFDKAEEYFQ